MEEKGQLHIPDEYKEGLDNGDYFVDYDNSRLRDEAGRIVAELEFSPDDEEMNEADGTDAVLAAAGAAGLVGAVLLLNEVRRWRKSQKEDGYWELLAKDQISSERWQNLKTAGDIFFEEFWQSQVSPTAGMRAATGNLIFVLERLVVEERKNYRKALAFASRPYLWRLNECLDDRKSAIIFRRYSFRKQVDNLLDRLKAFESRLGELEEKQGEEDKKEKTVEIRSF